MLAQGRGHRPAQRPHGQHETGGHRCQAQHRLGVGGQEHRRRHHQQPQRAEREVHRRDRAAAPHPAGDDRLRRPALDHHHGHQQGEARPEQGERGRRQPRPRHPALHQSGEQGAAAGEHGQRARPVDTRARAGRLACGLVQVTDDQPQGEGADRQVDEEDPAPVGVRGQHTAQAGARDCGHRPHRGQPGLDPGPVLERVQVGGERLHGALEGAAAQALQDAEGDQGAHVPGEGAQQGAGEEQCRPRHQDRFAAVGVGELAVDGERDGDGQQIAGEEPGEEREATEVADDLRDGGGDDRGVECRQRHREHQGGHYGAAPVRARARSGRVHRGSGAVHAVHPGTSVLAFPLHPSAGVSFALDPDVAGGWRLDASRGGGQPRGPLHRRVDSP